MNSKPHAPPSVKSRMGGRHGKQWTDAEIEKLHAEYGSMPARELAAAMGRTVPSLKGRVNASIAQGYRLKRRRAAYYSLSEKERSLLSREYGRTPTDALAARFDLSANEVRWHARRMGLRYLRQPAATLNRHGPWTPADLSLIRREYGKTPIQKLAAHLGRSADAVSHQALLMGSRLRPRRLTATDYGLPADLPTRAILILLELLDGPRTAAQIRSSLGLRTLETSLGPRQRMRRISYLTDLQSRGLVCLHVHRPRDNHRRATYLYMLTGLCMDLLAAAGERGASS